MNQSSTTIDPNVHLENIYKDEIPKNNHNCLEWLR